MKKVLLPFVGLLCIASCNDNAEVVEESCLDFEFETQAKSSNLDYIQQRIGMEHPQTRVGETVSIEPYVYEGDTVMYIVNYEDGWELYSNDTSVPMVLGSAETGHFDTELDIFKAYIDGVVETLHSRFSNRSRNTVSIGEWLPYTYVDSISNKDTIYCMDNGTRSSSVFAPIICGYNDVIGEGHWELIGQPTINNDTSIVNHLVKTHWDQGEPWNAYTPLINGQHCLVGCVAVAIGQFMHYLATEKDFTFIMPNHGELVDSSYVFSGETSTIWSNMAQVEDDSLTLSIDSAALALGYIGQSVNMHYGLSESGSYQQDYYSFLSSLGLISFSVNITDSYLYNHLSSGIPFLLTVKNQNTGKGHMIVLDAGRKIDSRIRSVYGWHGTDKNGNDALLYDEDGNVRGYKYQCYRFDNITDYHFQMNWGWGRDYYDNIWLTNTLELTPDYTGNLAFIYTGFNVINSGL